MIPHNDTEHADLSAEAAEMQLLSFAREWAARLNAFLDSSDEELDQYLTEESEGVVALLSRYRHGSTDITDVDARSAARRVRALIHDPDPTFWRTALGRLVAHADGYSHPIVPRAHAAAILGYTRQRVNQLEQAGILHTAPDGKGVTNASVMRRLAGRG